MNVTPRNGYNRKDCWSSQHSFGIEDQVYSIEYI